MVKLIQCNLAMTYQIEYSLSFTGSSGYLRYRGPPSQAMDKRAMIADSSSESSVENLPYINPPPTGTLSAKRKPVLRQHNKGPAPRPMEPPAIVPMEQRDR